MNSARRTAFALLIVAAAFSGCSDDDSNGPSGSIDYSGTWHGTIGTDTPPPVTWTAVHNGNTVTGPFVVQVDATTSFTAVLTGTVTGSQIQLTLSLPAGGIPLVPACTIASTGTTTTATANSIIAVMATTFAQACVGTVSDGPTSTDPLTLTKS